MLGEGLARLGQCLRCDKPSKQAKIRAGKESKSNLRSIINRKLD